MVNSVFEWLGAATAILGAGILALNSAISGWGFVAFLVSNVFWVAFSVRTRTWGLLCMQIVFSATSVAGINNWFF
jgi:drug/metabolite transporter (DMT)-like permease